MAETGANLRSNLKIIGVIPARMHSERLPGKVLQPIAGRAMVHRVFDAAQSCGHLSELWVATDSPEVRDYCREHRIPVLMTAPTHTSGTERIYEVSQAMPAEVYVNIQGDEPMLSGSHLDLLLEPFFQDPSVQVTRSEERRVGKECRL